MAQTIHERWGERVLRTPGQSAASREVPAIPTRFPALDRLLGIGGIPRGQITEILGVATSGMSTLALKIMASAQDQDNMAVYLDPAQTFDPAYARRCGVNLTRLLLVRPASPAQTLDIAYDLIASGGAGILVLAPTFAEPEHAPFPGTLERLQAVLNGSPCAALRLTAVPSAASLPEGRGLAANAAVRLLIEKERWLRRRRDVRGYRARVTILKNKLAPPGGRVSIVIGFGGVVDGDGA